jgi:hypothetical protein
VTVTPNLVALYPDLIEINTGATVVYGPKP